MPVRLTVITLLCLMILGVMGQENCLATESRIQFVLDSPGSEVVSTSVGDPSADERNKHTVVAQANSDESAEEIAALYRRGKALYRAGDYAAASEVLKKVVKMDADYERAQQYLDYSKQRLALQQQEERRDAMENKRIEQQEAFQLKIEDLLDQAEAAEKRDDFDQAISLYQKVLRLDSENRKAARSLVKVRKAQERYAIKQAELAEKQEETARKAAEEARKEKEKQAELAKKREADQKAAEEARREEEKRTREQSELAQKQKEAAQKEALENLLDQAKAAARSDDYEKALSLYQKALRLDPGNRSATRGLEKVEQAKEKLAQKQEEAARKAAEEAEKEKERRAQEAAELAKKQEESAQRAAAEAKKEEERKAREAAELAKKQEEAAQKAAEEAKKEKERRAQEAAELAKKQEESAQRAAAEAKKEEERKAREAAELAKKQEEAAQKAAEEAQKEKERAQKAKIEELLDTADAQRDNEEYDMAIATLNEALTLEPDNTKTLKLMSKVEEEKEKALKEAEAAKLEQERKALEAELAQSLERAKVYLEADQLDQAETELTQVIGKDPENSQAQGMLERIAKRRQEIEAEQARLVEESKKAEQAKIAEKINCSLATRKGSLYRRKYPGSFKSLE